MLICLVREGYWEDIGTVAIGLVSKRRLQEGYRNSWFCIGLLWVIEGCRLGGFRNGCNRFAWLEKAAGRDIGIVAIDC